MNILLVDDEDRSRMHLAHFLGKLGHNVTEASNGKEALELLPTQEFDLLMTDNRMPVMTGLELLEAIRDLPVGQDITKVIFTSYGDMNTTVQAMRVGANDYLLKPLDVNDLVAMIGRVASLQASRKKQTSTNSLSPIPKSRPDTPPPDKSVSGYIRQRYTPNISLNEIGVFSFSMHRAYDLAQRFHTNRTIPVLIEGETGTGKEIVARYIHCGENNTSLPFVALNCATFNPNMFESELFGYEAGAFSGALSVGNKGKLDIACGGTLFLDEISELPLNLQAKLLRVLQEKEFYRVGGLKLIKTDVRVICASNKNLEEAVKQGTFRMDLFYRLNVGHIWVPPLRERKEDILPLARIFLKELGQQANKPYIRISPSAAKILLSYEWPGNVRELRNLMELMVLFLDEGEIKPHHLDLICRKRNKQMAEELISNLDVQPSFTPAEDTSLNKLSNSIILKALAMHNGNKTETAHYLNISRSSLYNRLRQMEGN